MTLDMKDLTDIASMDSCVDVTRVQQYCSATSQDRATQVGSTAAFRKRRFVEMDVICSSHIDAVGKLNAYDLVQVSRISGLEAPLLKQLLSDTTLFCAPEKYPTIILDFSCKADYVWSIIESGIDKTIRLEGHTGLLPAEYAFDDFDKFRQLFLSLCITREEIIDMLSKNCITLEPDTILAIYTDWFDQFNPLGSAKFYGEFELWHPFLLHPYFDERSLHFLNEELKVGGFATDAPTLEPPIYYCSETGRHVPNVLELRNVVSRSLQTRSVHLPAYPFLHIKTICSKRLLVESLDFSKVMMPGKHFVEGELILFPLLADAVRWESIPTRALFRLSGNKQSY